MSRVPGVVTLPADVVGKPGNLPRHCARHGLPAVRQQNFVLQSKVKVEGNRFLHQSNVIGMGERLSDYGKKVRTADVKEWPLCRKCASTRALWLAVASVMFFGGLATFVGSLVVSAIADDMQWLGGVAFAGFALLPLAAFPFSLGSLPRLTGARTSSDGASVIIESPSEAFAAELPAQ